MRFICILLNRLRRGAALGLLSMLASTSATAVSQDITALFTPDSANPLRNEFINTTPPSGYCAIYPEQCRTNGMFSIRLPIEFQSITAVQPNDEPRNSAMLQVPTQWRELTVTNNSTGETEKVEVRIAGVGSRYTLSDTAANLTGAPNDRDGHHSLWSGGGWVYASPPCQYSGVGGYGPATYTFFWKTPSDGACVKTSKFLIPEMSYSYLDFAYELRTPNPLGMSSGLYMGNISYRVGPGGDFDMGDVMLPTDTDITLNFLLTVEHTLKVDLPPGSEKIHLAPAGGWQSWLYAGRRPVRLFRDQTFNISASSRFKMQLDCAYTQDGKTCALRDAVSGHVVPLDVHVSLPNGLTDVTGQPVNRRQLFRDASGTKTFQPGFYVDRKPGTLHFEVPAQELAEMIHPGQSRRYTGNVTIIWDSDI